jgi:Holliday junction resolvase RusA-like endonuclease
MGGEAPMIISFFVPGIPRPGGSKRYLGHRGGKPIIIDDCAKNKDWRAVVALAAKGAMGDRPPLTGPLAFHVEFYFPRPKSHYGKFGLKLSAPEKPMVRPDLTKIARSTEDALTGIAWRDDSQIVTQTFRKIYSVSVVGASIEVKELE